MKQMKTITLSIALTMISGAFAATHALATNINSGEQIAISFNQGLDHSTFGNIAATTQVVRDEAKAVPALAQFFGPDPKRVLVRTYMEYNVLKQAALASGDTTPERVAQTEVVVVPEFAAAFGIIDIDSYVLERGLVTMDEKTVGGLDFNNKVVTCAFNDISARALAGELKPISGMLPTELA